MTKTWINEVPEDWRLLRLGSLFNLRNQKVSDKDYPPLSVSKGGVVPQMESVAKSDASDDRKLVLNGDFAINSRSDRKQSCGVAPMDGSVSLINTILYAKDDKFIFTPYLNYLLKNHGFAEEFYKWGHGIVADLWTTRWQEMKSIILPIPSYEEQIKLTAILDKKINQIDELISNQEKQIEKLEEYKQSIITKAVTKGLDPNSRMKDSGVEWIGEIPENLSLTKISRLYEITLGKMLQPKQEESDDALCNYLCAANIKWGGVDTNLIKQMWFSKSELSKYELHDGDCLIMEGGNAGTATLYHSEAAPCFFQNSINRANGINGNSNEYLVYWLAFICHAGYVDAICNKATLKHFTKEKVEETSIIARPIAEQINIVAYLNKKTKEISKLQALKSKKIEKLVGFKKSIIYEYVTGKKRVA